MPVCMCPTFLPYMYHLLPPIYPFTVNRYTTLIMQPIYNTHVVPCTIITPQTWLRRLSFARVAQPHTHAPRLTLVKFGRIFVCPMPCGVRCCKNTSLLLSAKRHSPGNFTENEPETGRNGA
mmetsp:Transcript_30670/g.89178  ORF Transcript_30670/g.89178 Transcript_30670/m.89178 type:complete len:121 (-) Transcript_30670:150-512(-)